MNFLIALAISALISVSGWLNDGLKSLEKKDYDAAIESLSKITKENSAGTKFYELALFYKAQAYQGKGDKDKALSDLSTLLKGECGKGLRVDAKKLFVELGGKPETLLPEESPTKLWAKFIGLIGNNERDNALELTTGEWKNILRQITEMKVRDGGDLKDLAHELGAGTIGAETLPVEPENGIAFLQINGGVQGDNVKVGFALDRESNRWLISSLRPDAGNGGGVQVANPPEENNISNINKLKQIGLACRMYSQEYKENFPNGFDELIKGGYLENTEMYVWISPQDGSKDKFIYCSGLNESSSVDFMLAAAPRPANGKREVLYTDGHAAMISEEEFQKTAKEQNWKVPFVAKFDKKDIPEEKQKLIRELVAKIADPKAEVRQDAKKKLREMGPEAFPVLEEFTNNSDPEIKLEVRSILKGK